MYNLLKMAIYKNSQSNTSPRVNKSCALTSQLFLTNNKQHRVWEEEDPWSASAYTSNYGCLELHHPQVNELQNRHYKIQLYSNLQWTNPLSNRIGIRWQRDRLLPWHRMAVLPISPEASLSANGNNTTKGQCLSLYIWCLQSVSIPK